MNSAWRPETVIQRPVRGFRAASRPREGAARQFQGFVAIVKAFAFRNLLRAQLRAWVMGVVVAEGAILFSLFQQFLHQRLNFGAIRFLAERATVAAILVLATELMGFKQVVETRLVGFAVDLHLLVCSLWVERRLMQPIFEGISILLNLLAVQGTAFVISGHLEALLANIGKNHANLLSLVQHGLLVGVKPGIPLLRVVKVFGGARVWIAQVVRGIVHAGQRREATALDRDGFRSWVIVHLHVEYERNLLVDLRGLA